VTTITRWLDDLARAGGDAPALVEPGREPVSFAALTRRAGALAGGLQAIGVRRGERIGVLLPNGIGAVEVFLAAGRLGAVVVGLNTRLRSDDLRHALDASGAGLLVSAAEFLGIDFRGVVSGALAGMEQRPRVVWPDELDRLRRGGERSPDAPPGDLAAPADLLVAFTTSGTTGRPKLAAHDHASVVRHARAAARAMAIGPGDASLLELPLCGTFGLVTLLSTLAGGGCTVIPARFDAGEAAMLVERHRVSHFNGSDDMLLAVLGTGADLGSWRQGVEAEFTSQGERAVAAAEAAGVRLTGVYGSSETFALLARWSPGSPVDLRARNGGTLVDPAMSVRAVDTSGGRVLGPGLPGELQFAGPSVLGTYLGDEEATRRAFTDDGWFRSGDLGFTEADGRTFVYLSRLGDSLRLAGFLTDPAEIEQRLLAHAGVVAAQVVGVPGPTGGDVAVAFVVAAGAVPTERQLIDHCRAALANYKVPRRVAVLRAFPTVDGPNGVKIRKADLRQRAVRLLAQA